MKLLSRLTGIAIVLLALVAPAAAQSTLDQIIARGKIIVGVSSTTPPYGMLDANMKLDGYDIGLAKLIARDLGVEVEFVDTLAANRIPNLLSKKVDIVIEAFSITAERAKAIAFSNAVFQDGQVYISLGDKPAVGSLADLAGKRVGVTRSSTNDIVVTKNAPPGTNILRFEDDALTSQAMLSGQVDGIVTSEVLTKVMQQGNPSIKVQFTITSATMGIGLRRGDPDFLRWLNTEIFLLTQNGEMAALQRKYMKTTVDLARF